MEKVSQLRAGLHLLPFSRDIPAFRGFVKYRGRHLKGLAHKILLYLFSVYGDRLGTDSL